MYIPVGILLDLSGLDIAKCCDDEREIVTTDETTLLDLLAVTLENVSVCLCMLVTKSNRSCCWESKECWEEALTLSEVSGDEDNGFVVSTMDWCGSGFTSDPLTSSFFVNLLDSLDFVEITLVVPVTIDEDIGCGGPTTWPLKSFCPTAVSSCLVTASLLHVHPH